MMELKEGMYYTRSEDGRLGLCKCEGMTLEQYVETYKKRYHIKKASYNIIDLIEEDDLIKCQFGEQILILQVGARYTTSNPENGWVKGVFTLDNEFWSLETLIQEDILQSIVTKEQFESMSYRVKD